MKLRKVVLGILVAVGVASTAYYFSWWIEAGVLTNPLLFPLFLVMAFYLTTQALFPWFIYLHAGRGKPLPPERGQERSVDVFLPTFGEPIELVKSTLHAIMAIRYPHTTYVIDDGNNDDVREAALVAGAKYIRRPHRRHNKAGNINNALKASGGDLVAIFDVDHVPDPEFLDRVIPCFDDPAVGVAQVAIDHHNLQESFIASACGRMSDEFFAATMRGMDRLGCAMVFGSNAIFRRTALRDMGGYQPGLAEDLNTSLHLHAAGWKSVYVPEIVAKGLVPSDLDAFIKQQYKWARGVFEVLFRQMPARIGLLSGKQRICYATRMTYYLAGPVIALHILAALLAPLLPGSMDPVDSYVAHSIPFLITYIVIHGVAYRLYALKPASASVSLRGPLLTLASWPAYSIAFVRALLRKEPRFVSTPKEFTGLVPVKYVAPQVATVLLLLAAVVGHLFFSDSVSRGYVVMVGMLIFMHIGLLPGSAGKRFIRDGAIRRVAVSAE